MTSAGKHWPLTVNWTVVVGTISVLFVCLLNSFLVNLLKFIISSGPKSESSSVNSVNSSIVISVGIPFIMPCLVRRWLGIKA